MKKKVGKNSKSKVFNSLNIILIALVLLEVAFVVNEGVLTGQPVRGVRLDGDENVNLGSTTSSSLGQLVTKEGTVELIIEDNFENPELSKELYYLNENGERYLLSTDTSLPVSAKIKITGYLRDNTLTFASSSTKDVGLQGTSYTMTSTTIEPWPKTLGEQRYVAVFLLEESDTNFDYNLFANITFNLTNEYLIETSYGKANVSYPYLYVDIYNELNTDIYEVLYDALEKVDPFVNFNDYDGIVIFHPNKEWVSYAGLGSLGKIPLTTDDGEVNIYSLWMNLDTNKYSPESFGIFAHEIGHNFGLPHASEIYCGDYPNRKSLGALCYLWSYGDYFDIMGISERLGQYNLRSKVVTLGWINDENVPEINEGVYLISPFEDDSAGTSKIQGLKIPIIWNSSSDVNVFEIFLEPLSAFNPLTHYYLEYRTSIYGLGNPPLSDYYDNETTYGLNFSNISGGVLIRLGRNDMFWYDGNNPAGYSFLNTFLLSMHPNAQVCNEGICDNSIYISQMFSYILKGETYLDSFNQMSIKVLDMNDSGALVSIQPFVCADINHDGVRDIIDVSLLINTAFRNDPEPQPKWIGDLDASNAIDVLDVVIMINHVFRGGVEPTCTVSQTTTSSSGTLSISQGTANTDGTTNILVYSNTPTTVSAEKFKLSYNTDISIAGIATSTGMDIYRKPAAGGEIINILSSSGSKTIKGNTLILTIKAKNTKGTKDFSSMKLESPLIIDTSSKTYKTVNVQNTIKPPSQTKPTCTDTDKGKAYDIKGTVTITNSSGTFNYQDTCVTSSKLKEFYCNNVQAAFVSYSCPNGCLDGKCKIQEKVVRICTKGKLACAVGKLFGYYQK